jgi:hypothetical protein
MHGGPILHQQRGEMTWLSVSVGVFVASPFKLKVRVTTSYYEFRSTLRFLRYVYSMDMLYALFIYGAGWRHKTIHHGSRTRSNQRKIQQHPDMLPRNKQVGTVRRLMTSVGCKTM